MTPLTLKKACEIALARQFANVPGLRAITPKIWDSKAAVRMPHLSIQANPTGEEMVYGADIYMVECEIRVQGKARKGYTVADYIALADGVWAELVRLDKAGLEARFAGSGVYVHGVIPRQLPATIEGDTRVDLSGGTLVAHLA